MTKFSIITVTHNDLKGLKRTSTSITEQCFTDYEWIVVDGNSQDGTTDYLTAQTLTHKWVSEPDNGLYDAMNKGLSMATGDYIVFMNSGDCIATPQTLHIVSQHLNIAPDLIYGDSLQRYAAHKPLHYKAAKPIAYRDALMTHHQSIYYNRCKIGSLRYNTSYKIAADFDFTHRFFTHNNNNLYIAEPLCIFDCNGLSMRNSHIGRKETFIIRQELGLASGWLNYYILVKQWLAQKMLRFTPALYRSLSRF